VLAHYLSIGILKKLVSGAIKLNERFAFLTEACAYGFFLLKCIIISNPKAIVQASDVIQERKKRT
jgi:hypothetical protein